MLKETIINLVYIIRNIVNGIKFYIYILKKTVINPVCVIQNIVNSIKFYNLYRYS